MVSTLTYALQFQRSVTPSTAVIAGRVAAISFSRRGWMAGSSPAMTPVIVLALPIGFAGRE